MIKKYDEIDYSEKGDYTRYYSKSKNGWDVKLEYKNPIKGILKGLGSWAYKLFEKDKKRKGIKEIKLTAGVQHWGGKWNKLAANFWEKMGFTTKTKMSGKPRRYFKRL